MHWLTFVAGAVLSWGVYGAMLHQGQTKLGSPLRALLCVGMAYFLIGVIVPLATMMSQGQLDSRGWNSSGATFATVAGALGALGAVCIIFSFRAGGLPTYVMCHVLTVEPARLCLLRVYRALRVLRAGRRPVQRDIKRPSDRFPSLRWRPRGGG